jgi:hypothetical protein
MSRGMILIDGSYLFGSITRLKDKNTISKNSLLNIAKFSNCLVNKWHDYISELVRVTYYFKKTIKE